MSPRILAPLAVVGVLALAGCAAPSEPAAEGLSIVASTSVYGDIASRIAGEAATVTSIIDSPAQDPHSYEASAQDQLALSKADLVIENGGGYDPFIDTLLDAGTATAVVLSASEVSGLMPEEGQEAPKAEEDDHDHAHVEGFNEHVWYDLHSMEKLAEALAEELSVLDPENADLFAANAEEFAAELETLEVTLDTLHERLEGSSVLVTEPVALYLLAESGLDNVTPEAFTEAIEEGADVPPTALNDVLSLIESGDIDLLAYNSQTASAETERVREAADAAGIPVVEFTETLPDGQDYVSWMTANLAAITAALPE